MIAPLIRHHAHHLHLHGKHTDEKNVRGLLILFKELKIEPDEYREAWDSKKSTQDRVVRKIGRPKTLIIIVLVSLFLSIMGFLWVI